MNKVFIRRREKKCFPSPGFNGKSWWVKVRNVNKATYLLKYSGFHCGGWMQEKNPSTGRAASAFSVRSVNKTLMYSCCHHNASNRWTWNTSAWFFKWSDFLMKHQVQVRVLVVNVIHCVWGDGVRNSWEGKLQVCAFKVSRLFWFGWRQSFSHHKIGIDLSK